MHVSRGVPLYNVSQLIPHPDPSLSLITDLHCLSMSATGEQHWQQLQLTPTADIPKS